MIHTTIAFLGQCQTYGYPGVPADATFPQVCRRALETRLPHRRIRVVTEEYQHPSELPKATDRVVRAQPRVVVLEVIGWLAVKSNSAVDLSKLPRGVRSTYDRARHFRRLTSFLKTKVPETAGLVHRVETNAHALASGILRPLLPRYPRPTIAEYESFVDDAIAQLRRIEGMDVVVQGPGAPNLELEERGLATDMPERYREVERMAQRVAKKYDTLYVDRWSTLTPRCFLPNTIRPRAHSHELWGNLLAHELLAAGLV